MANDEIRPRRVHIRPSIPDQRRQWLDPVSVDRLLAFAREVQAQIDELVAEGTTGKSGGDDSTENSTSSW